MSNDKGASALAILGRVYWIMLGPLLLAVLGFAILQAGPSWLTTADVVYLAILGSLIAVRVLEFRFGSPQTAEGEPATPDTLRRYIILTLTLGLVAWAAVNIVANYFRGVI